MGNERFTVHVGDNLPILKTLADNSVDAIVTDPPYGLSFMGKRWDYDVPSVELWAECLRVLKPGGHLLAFAGTRTQHRMAVRIEDAGFEIRDMIAWVYGSGFPKSHNVAIGIDKMNGAPARGKALVVAGRGERKDLQGKDANPRPQDLEAYAPATDAAKQWDGWGTALKPSFETVTFATKPLDTMGYCAIMIANLTERIESCRHNAKNAVKSLGRSQVDLLGGKINTAHASVATGTGEVPANETATGPEDATHLKAGTSASTLEAEDIALNTFLLWRRILEGVSSAAKTSTILTAFETTIDWKISSYCLLHVTPDIITQAKCNPNGLNASALRAVTYLNASLASCESILALFAVAPAMSQEAEACRGEDIKPNLDPCILARKPLAERTVAANVLEWGTGGVNVDRCRVGTDTIAQHRTPQKTWREREGRSDIPASADYSVTTTSGRFPANLIHDGSDEVVELFPQSTSGANPTRRGGMGYHGAEGQESCDAPRGAESGSAARFFYCAKASRSEREAGCEGLEMKYNVGTMSGDADGSLLTGSGNPRDTSARNHHPTVKPIALMRYLCRLVTPPGGIVLDPFTGSGTTGCAAMLEGFRFIGMEQSPEYAEIATKRIEYWLQTSIKCKVDTDEPQLSILDVIDES